MMNWLNLRRLITLCARGSCSLAWADSARAATPEACDLLPQSQVARIVGEDVPIAQRQPGRALLVAALKNL